MRSSDIRASAPCHIEVRGHGRLRSASESQRSTHVTSSTIEQIDDFKNIAECDNEQV